MIELLISLTILERSMLTLFTFIVIMFALYILKTKDVVKGKDGFSLVSGKGVKTSLSAAHECPISPVWEKEIAKSDSEEKDKIGFVCVGNYLKLYGNRWNSALDKQGYSFIRELMDTNVYIQDRRISYNFWILDITSCNIQSTLISLIVDKSKLFEKIYIITSSKNINDLKAISPVHSKIENIEIVISDEA